MYSGDLIGLKSLDFNIEKIKVEDIFQKKLKFDIFTLDNKIRYFVVKIKYLKSLTENLEKLKLQPIDEMKQINYLEGILKYELKSVDELETELGTERRNLDKLKTDLIDSMNSGLGLGDRNNVTKEEEEEIAGIMADFGKTSKRKRSKRKTSKRKTSKRKTSKRKRSKRKTSKRKTSKR
jgi:hypothetical protein